MEFLQKIPYWLSMFFPIAAFFALGLWMAWWRWNSQHRRFAQGVQDLQSRTDRLEQSREKEHLLSQRVVALVGGEKNKTQIIAERDREICHLTSKVGALGGKVTTLENASAELEPLKLKLTDLSNSSSKEIAGLSSRLSDREKEIADFRSQLALLDQSVAAEKRRADDKEQELGEWRANFHILEQSASENEKRAMDFERKFGQKAPENGVAAKTKLNGKRTEVTVEKDDASLTADSTRSNWMWL